MIGMNIINRRRGGIHRDRDCGSGDPPAVVVGGPRGELIGAGGDVWPGGGVTTAGVADTAGQDGADQGGAVIEVDLADAAVAVAGGGGEDDVGAGIDTAVVEGAGE